jgi:hypothetical protein
VGYIFAQIWYLNLQNVVLEYLQDEDIKVSMLIDNFGIISQFASRMARENKTKSRYF